MLFIYLSIYNALLGAGPRFVSALLGKLGKRERDREKESNCHIGEIEREIERELGIERQRESNYHV